MIEVCLALAVWHEARGEPELGQKLVAAVVLNRVKDKAYPNDVCKVVFDKKQFSFIEQSKEVFVTLPEKERKEWITKASKWMREGPINSRVTHFHSINVAPWWSKSFERITRVGNHVFYSKETY